MNRGRAAARQMLLRELISSRPIASQEELVSLLEQEGFRVTQTTVSRDLTAIGAVKVSTENGERYRLAVPADVQGEALPALTRSLSDFAVSIEGALNQAVIRTLPGGASPVAAALDAAVFEAAQLDGVLGTLAGDDTILVVCTSADEKEETSGPGIARRLKLLLRPEG